MRETHEMIRWLINALNAARNRAHRAEPEYVRHVGPWRRPWDMPATSDTLTVFAAIVNRGVDCWAAREPGECTTCGHEWIAGEIIGAVQQAYARLDDGSIVYAPDTRLACCVCVEQQRVQGDPSFVWAAEAGVLLRPAVPVIPGRQR